MEQIDKIDIDDVVFHVKDKYRRNPIRITSKEQEKNEMTFRGSMANSRGIIVNRKFLQSELILANQKQK